LENPRSNSILFEMFGFLLGLIFWVYVTWYSTRLVARAKQFQRPDDDPIWEIFRVQTPRILAFSCITIILLAFLQLKNYGYPNLSMTECHLILLFSYVWYILIYKLWSLYLQQGSRSKRQWIGLLKNIRTAAYWIMASFSFIMMKFKSFPTVIVTLIVLQIGLVLVLLIRRELDEASSEGESKNLGDVTPRSSLWKRIKYNILYDENKKYVWFFIAISIAGVGLYLTSIIWIRRSVELGPFPFVLLAFGVLLGFGNFLAYLSVLSRLNWHFFVFTIAIIFGFRFDSHKLKLPEKNIHQPRFSQRQSLKEYFRSWLNNPERKEILDDTTAAKYPVYFVMANGGASRSGYWTARILSELEDTSNGNFSKHLICLSGASGGSVGNATFFSLLRARDSLKARNLSFSQAAGDYLKSDFLTFTLAHLLGPDIFRNIFPFFNLLEMDRGRALALALEKAPPKKSFLYDSFHVNFSSFITQRDTQYSNKYNLPVLCINVTRMQDGNPAVFSNIRIGSNIIEKNYFNQRIDILDQLGESRDIKLSTAVVLGASFPYISPAGRIDNPILVRNNKTGKLESKEEPQYFVDGGYFDNSGAGVVNEMIAALNNMLDKDKEFNRYKNRLEFFVLHILNTEPKNKDRTPLNAVTNDLMAPAKTMIGSWGKQTTINDERLISYLHSVYADYTHYKKIDLYDNPQSDFRYSMNWVISDKQIAKMDEALFCNEVFRKEKRKMAGWKN
ncbi:MAG TPA: patatin-like phospholipase family protein, partial [Chitinophagaceae bacterium]|nr:patatin-like phospholipase family protein [Chitinophagaceae bacterium]